MLAHKWRHEASEAAAPDTVRQHTSQPASQLAIVLAWQRNSQPARQPSSETARHSVRTCSSSKVAGCLDSQSDRLSAIQLARRVAMQPSSKGITSHPKAGGQAALAPTRLRPQPCYMEVLWPYYLVVWLYYHIIPASFPALRVTTTQPQNIFCCCCFF